MCATTAAEVGSARAAIAATVKAHGSFMRQRFSDAGARSSKRRGRITSGANPLSYKNFVRNAYGSNRAKFDRMGPFRAAHAIASIYRRTHRSK